jgi:hypothetical protein
LQSSPLKSELLIMSEYETNFFDKNNYLFKNKEMIDTTLLKFRIKIQTFKKIKTKASFDNIDSFENMMQNSKVNFKQEYASIVDEFFCGKH